MPLESETGRRSPLVSAALAVLLVVVLFLLSLSVGRIVSRSVGTVLTIGDSGTLSSLVLSIVSLQVLGFGAVLVPSLWRRERHWRSYLRIGDLSVWTLFYGAAVGLGLMLIAVGATVFLTVLGIDPAESQTGAATDPLFYVVLFVLSSLVAVPMEELFFRGLLQRRLEESVHPAFAVGVASVLFMFLHTGVSVGAGGEAVALVLFFSFGVVLGASYYLTENLLVPVVGHVIFNGVQILIRGLEVAV